MKIKKIVLILILISLVSGCEMSEKEICESAGGKWNECGNPCAGTDSEFCIQVCKAQCECNERYTCPDGYKCRITKKDEFGVCIEE